jgi:probable phosphoglycerate mutase
MGELILVRHGETEWSKAGRHTGRTDVPLTEDGEIRAAELAPALARRTIVAVFTSPAARAVRTAELAGLAGLVRPRQDADLQEWDYGGYEGRTTAQIRADRPGWYRRDGIVPAGNSSGRDRRPGRAVPMRSPAGRPVLAEGDVALVAHGHRPY